MKNCIKANYIISEQKVRENTKIFGIVSLITFIAGIAGLLAYIVISVSYEMIYDYSPKWCDAFLISAVPFVVGFVLWSGRRTSLKAARKNDGLIKEYEFYSDCIITRDIWRGMQTAFAQIHYINIAKVRLKKGELFIYCFPTAVFYPVDISSLSEAELNTIKKLLRQSVEGETVALGEYGKDEKKEEFEEK